MKVGEEAHTLPTLHMLASSGGVIITVLFIVAM